MQNYFKLKTKTIKQLFLMTGLIIGCTLFIVGCKKKDADANPDPNPTVIPIQTTQQAIVPMAGTTSLAILAGSAITNTGATNVTGDIGLSPGTSVGGFPPG